MHGRAEIWNLSSSVHIDIERMSECEHEEINSISPSVHVLFCLLYKDTNNDSLTTFRRFPTTLQRFPKIFQNCSEGLVNIFRTFSEDYRG